MSVCAGTKRNGEPCMLPATQGSAYCWNHDPARAEERSRNASRAASAKHSSVAQELRDVHDLIWDLLGVVVSDRLSVMMRKELQSVVQLLNCYLRAAELEMRAAEQPLEPNLDVAGLKEQVLWRLETLEQREREREELLAEIVPLVEASGYETGSLRAAMGG